MNEKHAREARIINRMLGNLKKPNELPFDEKTGVRIGRSKLSKVVKNSFDAQSHRKRGKLTRSWRRGVVKYLKDRGITLNAVRQTRRLLERDVVDGRQWFRSQPRSVRNAIRREYNRNNAP